MWSQIRAQGKWEGEIWNRRKSGEVYPQWLTISRVDGTSGNDRHYVGVFADMTQRKLAEEEIERLAFYDSLTGLPNRYLLKDRARQHLLHAERSGGALAMT
ncbi:PAS domain S-box protein, partial [Arthrospira platensis SPKY1]|nr:PAS domain S-box protein [Arthrospira platensis SPKY1]